MENTVENKRTGRLAGGRRVLPVVLYCADGIQELGYFGATVSTFDAARAHASDRG
jgi:hypothetical protein